MCKTHSYATLLPENFFLISRWATRTTRRRRATRARTEHPATWARAGWRFACKFLEAEGER